VAFYTARVEYALHTVLNLLRAGPQSSPSARELADFQRLPVAFTRRLLSQLEKAGIVTGTEGVRGGWRLARPADELTVLEVADAAQGIEPLFDCREIRRHCALWADDDPPPSARRGVCSINAVMLRAEAAMRRELAATTIADLAIQLGAKAGPAAARAVPVWFATEYARRRPPRDPAARLDGPEDRSRP
jgi:Rrf2 family protein